MAWLQGLPGQGRQGCQGRQGRQQDTGWQELSLSGRFFMATVPGRWGEVGGTSDCRDMLGSGSLSAHSMTFPFCSLT